jgi:DNA-binding protein H-NS
MIEGKEAVSSTDDPKHRRRRPRKQTETKPSVQARKEIEFVPIDAEKAPRGRPRYRDPSNPFNTWGGRGKRPDWLRKYLEQDRQLAEFEIHYPED